MTTITTRAAKGSPLEWAEVDANFTNLNTGKAEVSDITCFVSPTTPTFPAGKQSLWVQTGLGVGGTGITFWINTP